MEPQTGIDFVYKLNPVNFDWNMRDGGKVNVPDQGFIAQELEQVQQDTHFFIPGLVCTDNPDKMCASYGKLIPVMVQSMKDLKNEINALKQEIEQLKNNN